MSRISREIRRQAELKAKLQAAFRSRLGPQIRNLEIEVRGNACVLSGDASSFYVKQLAQVVAMHLGQFQTLQNEIAVTAH